MPDQEPDPQGPLQVKLTPVKTEVPHLRPWVRYEFVDPALESLSCGQKILVRRGLPTRRGPRRWSAHCASAWRRTRWRAGSHGLCKMGCLQAAHPFSARWLPQAAGRGRAVL